MLWFSLEVTRQVVSPISPFLLYDHCGTCHAGEVDPYGRELMPWGPEQGDASLLHTVCETSDRGADGCAICRAPGAEPQVHCRAACQIFNG